MHNAILGVECGKAAILEVGSIVGYEAGYKLAPIVGSKSGDVGLPFGVAAPGGVRHADEDLAREDVDHEACVVGPSPCTGGERATVVPLEGIVRPRGVVEWPRSSGERAAC